MDKKHSPGLALAVLDERWAEARIKVDTLRNGGCVIDDELMEVKEECYQCYLKGAMFACEIAASILTGGGGLDEMPELLKSAANNNGALRR